MISGTDIVIVTGCAAGAWGVSGRRLLTWGRARLSELLDAVAALNDPLRFELRFKRAVLSGQVRLGSSVASGPSPARHDGLPAVPLVRIIVEAAGRPARVVLVPVGRQVGVTVIRLSGAVALVVEDAPRRTEVAS